MHKERKMMMNLLIKTLVVAVTLVLGLAIEANASDSYKYDHLNRLYRVNRSDGFTIQYDYDAAGNITAIKQGIADSDFDGIANSIEQSSCTNSFSADTDNDGIPDGVEDADHDGIFDIGETNPCVADTDGDGLQDGLEKGYVYASIGPDTNISVFLPDSNPSQKTNALNPDSDGDGILDGVEDANGNGQIDIGETSPSSLDSDGDGIPDGIEDTNHNGRVDSGEGDPLIANTDMTDTDGDGLINYLEGLICTDPLNEDSDGDNALDGREDLNHNGMVDSGERNPCLNEPAIMIPIIQLILD